MMTLEQLAKRLNDILAEKPEYASKPVYLKVRKSRRTTEYVPIQFALSSLLSIGDTIQLVELDADEQNVIIWDSAKGIKNPK